MLLGRRGSGNSDRRLILQAMKPSGPTCPAFPAPVERRPKRAPCRNTYRMDIGRPPNFVGALTLRGFTASCVLESLEAGVFRGFHTLLGNAGDEEYEDQPPTELKRLWQFEDEKHGLRQLVAELSLAKGTLRDFHLVPSSIACLQPWRDSGRSARELDASGRRSTDSQDVQLSVPVQRAEELLGTDSCTSRAADARCDRDHASHVLCHLGRNGWRL